MSLSHGLLHSHSSGMHTLDVISFHSTRSRPVSGNSLCPALQCLHLQRVLYTRKAGTLKLLCLVPTAKPFTFNLIFPAYLTFMFYCCHPNVLWAQGLYQAVALHDNLEEVKARTEISPVSSNRFATRAYTINQRLSWLLTEIYFTTDLLPITEGYKLLVITCCSTGSAI